MSARKKKKKVRLKPRFYVIMAVVALLVLLLVVKLIGGLFGGSDESKKAEEPKSKKVEINVTMAGDLVIHAPVFEGMRKGKSFDFTPCFKYVKKYIEPADAAICTFEGSLVSHDFTGYPMFRTPKKLAKDIKSVGFDLMTVTSNHAVDGGTAGFDSTIKATEKAGLIPSGGQLSEKDPDYAMIEVKDGVKIAFISYSYNDGTPKTPALNGNILPKDMEPLF
jgi:poly-gamma-glutamate synthesis protein (capsule biosynthesis protein)